MKIRFCGAAKAVTGSCHMISYDGGSILVDCGMRQGADAKTEYGESELPFVPADIKAVLLTHAHIDHTGLVPLLVKKGFRGSIIATEATASLCGIMLPDSAHIQEQDAEYQNKKNKRSGKPMVEPLYTAQDVENTLKLFRPVRYETTVSITEGVEARFNDVGHLLGSSAIEIWVTEGENRVKVVFSGDLGRDGRPIMKDPDKLESADYLVMESTYGDRLHNIHTEEEKERELARVFRNAIARGGNIVIPAFAVGRTQEMLYYIKKMLLNGTVPGLEDIPVYVDSPLGIKATRIYAGCGADCYDDEAKAIARSGDLFEFDTLNIAASADESRMINQQPGCNIIISSSGMCDAGRIRHHLKHNLYRADSTILFAGYQAYGTLGRRLIDGAEKVKILGEQVIVNADIQNVNGFSGHADRQELTDWIKAIPVKPRKIFLVHGEEDVIASFKEHLENEGYSIEVPSMFEEFDLDTGSVYVTTAKESRVEAKAQQLPSPDTAQELRRLMALLVEAATGNLQGTAHLAEEMAALSKQLENALGVRR